MQFDGNHEQPLVCFCRMLSRRTALSRRGSFAVLFLSRLPPKRYPCASRSSIRAASMARAL